MARHGTDSDGIGRITRNLGGGTLVQKTVAFVLGRLPEWRDDPDRPEHRSEEDLNSDLCKFLEARARESFPMVCFHREERQTDRRRVDLAALPSKATAIEARRYTIYEPFLVLEGKRLPPPSADREREYVSGMEKTSGGVQRFKLGLHGSRHDVAAMIGYIESGSATDWHRDINIWIGDLANGFQTDGCDWHAEDMLQELVEDGQKKVATCLSTHARSGDVVSEAISLHHMWIVMNRQGGDKSRNLMACRDL